MTPETIAQIVTGLVVAGICWSVVCRVIQMHPGVTTTHVFVQHATLGIGMLGGAVLPHPWGALSMALGVFVFLLMGSGRWRFGAPDGTLINPPTKP